MGKKSKKSKANVGRSLGRSEISRGAEVTQSEVSRGCPVRLKQGSQFKNRGLGVDFRTKSVPALNHLPKLYSIYSCKRIPHFRRTPTKCPTPLSAARASCPRIMN